MKGYPHWFLKTLLATSLLVFASGSLLVPNTLMFHLDEILAWRISAQLRMTTAAVHASLSFALLFLIGALWSVHMRAGWKKKKGRRSGLILALLISILLVSALLIYYTGDQVLSHQASLVHLAVGFLASVFMLGHAVRS